MNALIAEVEDLKIEIDKKEKLLSEIKNVYLF